MFAKAHAVGRTGRYVTLDGLRGVAALLVVLFHIFSRLPGWERFGAHGYLAVDFFLMLSGFVIALSYKPKLRSCSNLVGFFARRTIRLYPLALLGAAVGVAGLWVYQSFRAGGAVPFEALLTASALNMLILPYFSSTYFDTALFPANIPLWSLFGEIAVNIIWACAVVFGVTTTITRGVMIAAGIIFCYSTLIAGSANLGWSSHNFIAGVARVLFCFLLGTVCYDLRDYLPKFKSGENFLPLAVALSIALMLPVFHAVWDIMTVLLVLPLILLCGITAGPRRRAPMLEFIGEISYPLYIIHYPIIQVVLRLRDKFSPTMPPIIGGLCALFAAAAAAIIVYYLFDIPVRRALARYEKTKPVLI